ncbi:cytochrome-c peroxidase [Pseudohongiella spirulinae]|uniref:Cytochrome c peroxidase n=1 Tax=Pseudohongiella spirulinae TaxID=1249552 RepID=A0A0S2KCZ3_9GAMM|nr:cytochrome c peroxidase [Pseudohongiella spirulinae]ALO45855.1 Cytochrome c peroxidase [Pseudohongiella spirulinae]
MRQAISKTLLFVAVSGAVSISSAQTQEAGVDSAHIAFLQALGEPALIGANADHELAPTAYRPVPAFRQDQLDADKLRLGFDLFHERRLSVDNSVGCNSCHSGMFGGTDGRTVSTGANGAQGLLNAPTTFNAAYNFRQFWDGRAVTLSDQALGPIENDLEMAHSLSAVLQMLEQDSNYPDEFSKVYPDGISVNNMADAIAYFQTVNFSRSTTPFVRHLDGQTGQLSEQALRGWQRFDEVGCLSCHNGINLGGNSYQTLGAALDYFVEHRVAGPADNGVFNRTQREEDLHLFKVPTLHGVAETAPYFHDGSIDTLEAAIEEMGEHQLGRMLSEQDVEDIAAFLRSLGGRPMGMAMGSMGMGRGMGMRQPQTQGQGHGQEHNHEMNHGGQGMGRGQGMNHGSGSQGGGMHHDQGRMSRHGSMPGAMGSNDGTGSAPENPSSITITTSHQKAYAIAIQVAESAPERLIAEMQKVVQDEVKNYDFLQFEHLELIRHARALQHTPATLSSAQAAGLAQAAEQLLEQAHKLEWIIADFLRAVAMRKIMESHIEEPELSELAAELGDPVQQRDNYQRVALNLIGDMQETGISELAAGMRRLYSDSQ